MIPQRHSCGFSVVAFVALVLSPLASYALSFDPAAQFSPTVNPNGLWSYGFENLPFPSTFGLLTLPVSIPSSPGPAIDSWQLPAVGLVGVFHNGTTTPQTVTSSGQTAIYQSDQVAMHPGPNDQYAIIQLTVPAPGVYTIQGIFEGIDTSGLTDTSVDLLLNNSIVASGTVIGDGPASDVPLTFTASLSVGDTLAFGVGGNPAYGTTALLPGAVVAAVPEPGTIVLVMSGVLGLAMARRKQDA